MNSIIYVALLAISIALTAKILKDLGVHKVVYNHTPGKCRYVAGITGEGSEDLALLSNGLVLISSGVYIPMSSHIKPSPGNLYLYDPTNEAAKAEPLTIEAGAGTKDWKQNEFYPAGITVWEEKGETTVYVVNTFTDQIHFFSLKLKEKKLVYRKSVSHEAIANPNNLVAVAKDQLYITNFLYFSNKYASAVEMITKLPLGSVWYYDGGKFVRVLDGLKGPNGIAVDKSKKYVYLAALAEERVRVYKIQPSTPARTNLTLVTAVDLNTGVDNINVDNQGALWIGCHPISYKVGLHMYDSRAYAAPSQVLKLSFNADYSTWQLEETFADDGSQLQGSSAAISTGNGKLIIGTVTHKTMICNISN